MIDTMGFYFGNIVFDVVYENVEVCVCVCVCVCVFEGSGDGFRRWFQEIVLGSGNCVFLYRGGLTKGKITSGYDIKLERGY